MTTAVEGETLLEALMPEGLCARCGQEEPRFHVVFSTSRMGEEASVTLGFCSNDCETAFVQAIPAVKSLPGL